MLLRDAVSAGIELQTARRPGQAIAKLVEIGRGWKSPSDACSVSPVQGKTFTIANVIRELDRPTLVISHNKTLAAQLYSEFKQFFPRNAVEYFVSYFDYYQPEAYIPRSDTYIEKDSSINEEIERLRLVSHERAAVADATSSWSPAFPASTASLRRKITERMLLTVKRGQHTSREAVLEPVGRHALRAQRREFFARAVPRPRRCGRGLSGNGR